MMSTNVKIDDYRDLVDIIITQRMKMNPAEIIRLKKYVLDLFRYNMSTSCTTCMTNAFKMLKNYVDSYEETEN